MKHVSLLLMIDRYFRFRCNYLTPCISLYLHFHFRYQMDSPVLPSMDPNWAVNTPYKSRQQSSGLSLTQPQAPSSILRPYGTSSSKNSARNALDGIYADIANKVEFGQHHFFHLCFSLSVFLLIFIYLLSDFISHSHSPRWISIC